MTPIIAVMCCHVFSNSVYKSVRYHGSSKLEKLCIELLIVEDDNQAIMVLLMQRNAVRATEISICLIRAALRVSIY